MSRDCHAGEGYCRTKDDVGLPRFVVRDACEHEGHRFSTYDCEAHEDKDLVEELAERIRELYVDEERLRAVLEQSIIGLEPVADPGLIIGAIAETVTATVPRPGQRRKHPWLDLAVVTREVVDSADRWQASESGVATVMVVGVDPGLQGSITGGI
jgi:hypothetical protein